LSEDKINEYAKCFMLGVMTTMSLKNTEEALNSGKKDEAKQELLGVLDILSEECLGSELCVKLKSLINDTVSAIEKDKLEEAKQQLGTIITLSFTEASKRG